MIAKLNTLITILRTSLLVTIFLICLSGSGLLTGIGFFHAFKGRNFESANTLFFCLFAWAFVSYVGYITKIALDRANGKAQKKKTPTITTLFVISLAVTAIYFCGAAVIDLMFKKYDLFIAGMTIGLIVLGLCLMVRILELVDKNQIKEIRGFAWVFGISGFLLTLVIPISTILKVVFFLNPADDLGLFVLIALISFTMGILSTILANLLRKTQVPDLAE